MGGDNKGKGGDKAGRRGDKEGRGVPIVAQPETNLTSIHEIVGLIRGLTWWVRDPVLL